MPNPLPSPPLHGHDRLTSDFTHLADLFRCRYIIIIIGRKTKAPPTTARCPGSISAQPCTRPVPRRYVRRLGTTKERKPHRARPPLYLLDQHQSMVAEGVGGRCLTELQPWTIPQLRPPISIPSNNNPLSPSLTFLKRSPRSLTDPLHRY